MRRCAARWCRRDSLRWPREASVEGELGLAGPHAPWLEAARGLDVPELEQGHGEPEQEASGQPLAVEGLLGSSVLAGLAPDGAGSAQGPRALEPRRLLGEEAAGTPPELHCQRVTGCGAAERTARESPLRHGRARRRGQATLRRRRRRDGSAGARLLR